MSRESSLQSAPGTARPARRRLCAAAFAATAAVVASVASAQAQDEAAALQDPGPACAERTGQRFGCDTQFTPIAKPSDEWDAVGGAQFDGDGELVQDSQTPHTVDFYSVRFESAEHGYAAGAACADPTTAFELVDSCPRVPVIWEYTVPPGKEGSWGEIHRGSGQGFVGAVAFLPSGAVLAVGGTGHYPRRELGREEDESDAAYAARSLAGQEPNAPGRARAWFLDPSTGGEPRFRERTPADLPSLPDGTPMGGLNALDCSPRSAENGLCAAGGYRQIWMWQGGEFTKAYTDKSPASDVDSPTSFRFRVRAIRFVPGASTSAVKAVAVTAGCCSGSLLTDAARVVLFDGAKWHLRELMDGPNPAGRENSPRQSFPDSYYSLSVVTPSGGPRMSVVATPGGPATSGGRDLVNEPSSRVIGYVKVEDPNSTPSRALIPPEQVELLAGDWLNEAAQPRLESVRLNAGDGNSVGPPTTTTGTGDPVTPTGKPTRIAPDYQDFTIDWAVGEVRPSGQGAAFTTTAALTDPQPLDCPSPVSAYPPPDPATLQKCEPNERAELERQTYDTRLIELSTYALNGFTFPPGSGVGWAVGDRGAIARLGGDSRATEGAQPDAPLVGQPADSPLPAAAPYDAYEEAASDTEVGVVPSAAGRPMRTLAEPVLLPVGSPDPGPAVAPVEDLSQMVMSRDGSEGWAVGPGYRFEFGTKAGTTLYRYDGQRWSRCDTETVPEQVEPDPACSALAVLRENSVGGNPVPIALAAIARIPLEADSDPSNDDEFEAIAVGDPYRLPGESTARPVVLHYADGRWSFDPAAMQQLSPSGSQLMVRQIAFTAPDDGWIVANSSTATAPGLFHFDGQGWTNCTTDRPACGDQGWLLPLAGGSASTKAFLSVAGRRVYLAGTRYGNSASTAGVSPGQNTTFPMVLYKDREGEWTAQNGGEDPGCASRNGTDCEPSGDPAQQGTITGVSVARAPGGGYDGWAAGIFGSSQAQEQRQSDVARALAGGSEAPLLRLGAGGWSKWQQDDAARDYLFNGKYGIGPPMLLTTPGAPGGDAWILPGPPPSFRDEPQAPLLALREGRWQAAGTPFNLALKELNNPQMAAASAAPRALTADGQGGFWLAVRQAGGALGQAGRYVGQGVFFYHYTRQVPERSFEDVPNPVTEGITGLAGAANGDVWVSTETNVVYHYDRVSGWDRTRVRGWDAGRVVTRPSGAFAVAVGPDGNGVVVGEQGRIGDLGPAGARLDAATGKLCDLAVPAPPCGTGYDLYAAAVGPGGSAMVGGERRALLFRPSGGQFAAIAPPPAPTDAAFTGISLPSAGTAWISTDGGQVWAGTGSGSSWSWELENVDTRHRPLTLNPDGDPFPLEAIAVDGSGHGYAVGQHGIALERTGGTDGHWRRLETGFRDDFYSVALPASGRGSGALIGGHNGTILTARGSNLEVARPADPWDPITNGSGGSLHTARIAGLALLPGLENGQAEAWAASQVPEGAFNRSPPPGAILHYTSDSSNPLLNPVRRAQPLSDAPPPGASELTFAAFGRSDCRVRGLGCPEPQGTNLSGDLVPAKIREALATRSSQSAAPVISLFTGDVNRAASRNQSTPDQDTNPDSPLAVDVMHRRWVETVANRFRAAELPLFGRSGDRT